MQATEFLWQLHVISRDPVSDHVHIHLKNKVKCKRWNWMYSKLLTENTFKKGNTLQQITTKHFCVFWIQNYDKKRWQNALCLLFTHL